MLLVNGIMVNTEKFPNDELHIKTDWYAWNKAKKANQLYDYEITFRYDGSDSVLELLFMLDRIGTKCYHGTFSLHMLYMPYLRMDTPGWDEFDTLSSFKNMLNSAKLDRIIVTSPHTEEALKNIPNMHVQYIEHELVGKALLGNGGIVDCGLDNILCMPDEGSLKRYVKDGCTNTYVVGYKTRDETGRIKNYTFNNLEYVKDKAVIIIDDLCVYGNTFYEIGKALKEHGASKVILCVAHLENSILNPEKGIIWREDNPIDKIYTSDTIFNGVNQTSTICAQHGMSRAKLYDLIEVIPYKELMK